MKPVYKEKVLSHFEGIEMRTSRLVDMIEGRRPSTKDDMVRLTKEIEQLLQQSKNLVEVS